MTRNRAGYLPINDYGLIGDCRSAALVGNDGSIDWLCLPRFDDPSIFGRLLDAEKGGFWQIKPVAAHTVTQRYRDRSNILRTTFGTSGGVVNVVDFMPVDAANIDSHARLHSRPRVVRIVECLAGEVEIENIVRAAPDYGRNHLPLSVSGQNLHGQHGKMHICIQSTRKLRGQTSRFKLKVGETVAFGLRASSGSCARHR